MRWRNSGRSGPRGGFKRGAEVVRIKAANRLPGWRRTDGRAMMESGARLFHMRIPPDAADPPSGTRASTEAIKVGLGAGCVQRAPYNGRPRRAEVQLKDGPISWRRMERTPRY
jgi:hypothetical protein